MFSANIVEGCTSRAVRRVARADRASKQRCRATKADLLHAILSRGTALGLAAVASLTAAPGRALPLLQRDVQYEQLVHSQLDASNKDLFTRDAWLGMMRLQRYADYMDSIRKAGLERAPGCEACAANRAMLERGWQTVANEYYDPQGHFTQAAWADQLLHALQERGGVLRTQQDTYSALTQLVGSLGDRYSAFLTPPAFRRALRRPLPAERSYLEAQYVGVGIQFGDLAPQGGRVVEVPLPASAAEAAGIRRGDRVLQVEGVPAEQLTLDETTALLRGPVGSTVAVMVAAGQPQRGVGNSGEAVRSLVLERGALPQPPVREARLTLPDGRPAVYVRVHYFSSAATRAVRAALEAGEREGVAGYVLDLRNDLGGVFEEAVAMAALLLDPTADIAETVRSGEVIDTTWRSGSLMAEIKPDLPPAPLTRRPVAVLVNSSSASASEVLAGALHDNGRALLVGETTFGKGVVQYYFPMGDGSGLKLTVAKYLTPARHDITREGGLVPDVACSDYPHGVATPGQADGCVLVAEQYLSGGRLPMLRPLYASEGGALLP